MIMSKSMIFKLHILCILLILCVSCNKKQNTTNTEQSRLVIEYNLNTTANDALEQQKNMQEAEERILKYYVLDIVYSIIQNDKASVAKLVEYPFPQPYPIKPILNEQEFILHYDRIISPELRNELQNSTYEDWHQRSRRGVYYKNGEIWIRDKSLMEEDTIDISEGYKLYAINYPNYLQKAALDSLREIEQTILGLEKNDSNAPQACYLSKDSTLLICLIGTNPTDKNAYINIYNRKTAFIPQVSAKISEIEDDNQCLNTYYTALIDNFTLVLSDADCCGRHISESSYMLSLSKTRNRSRSTNQFVDSIYHQYNTNHRCNIHLMPTYLHEVAKWW